MYWADQSSQDRIQVSWNGMTSSTNQPRKDPFETPFTSVSIVSRGHPSLVSLKYIISYYVCFYDIYGQRVTSLCITVLSSPVSYSFSHIRYIKCSSPAAGIFAPSHTNKSKKIYRKEYNSKSQSLCAEKLPTKGFYAN